MTACLVQLSDTHICDPGALTTGGVDSSAGLRNAIATVVALPRAPDAVLVSGDLVDAGRDTQYEALARLLEPLTMPVYLMVGNHDDRGALRRVFRDHRYLVDGGSDGFVQYDVAVGGLRLIALDTLHPGHDEGRLCERRLAWLESALAAHRGEPVIVALHHPPFATAIAGMDELALASGARELEAIVARHPNVERVVCGHVHRAIESRFGGTLATIAPSTAYQFQLTFGPDAPLACVLEPPAFRLYELLPGRGVVTHLLPVGSFAGPFPV